VLLGRWRIGRGYSNTRPGLSECGFVAKVYAGKLWIIGGFSNRRSVNFAEVWFTDDGKNWQEYKSDMMFSPRHEVTPYVFNGSLWVVRRQHVAR